jgi:hypothetical protein
MAIALFVFFFFFLASFSGNIIQYPAIWEGDRVPAHITEIAEVNGRFFISVSLSLSQHI